MAYDANTVRYSIQRIGVSEIKRVRRVLFCAVYLILAASGLFAQSSLPEPDLDLFDKYLDRADMSQTRDEWNDVSLSGEDAVMAKWESAILAVMGTGIDYDALRQSARDELTTVLEERLSAWLMDRFFSDYTGVDYESMLNDVKKSKIAGVFELNADGSIRTDAKGAPIRRELVDEVAFQEEFGAWQAQIRGLGAVVTEDWESRSTTAFNELLNGLDGEQRLRLEAVGATRLAGFRQEQQRQMDAVLTLEESNYRYLRLQDQYSLRLKSDDSSAESVVDALIKKTEASLEAGLDNLVKGLDVEVGEVVIDGTPLNGDDWQNRFRDALNIGLDRWKQAEEEFLVRRIEWERQAGKDLASGTEAWDDALRVLQEKQREWLSDFQEVRERGEARFDQRFAALEDARGKALAELDRNIMANRESLTERVETTVSMLNQSLGMMKTSRESMGYWVAKTTGNEAFLVDGVSWDVNGMRAALLKGMFTTVTNRLSTQNYYAGSTSTTPAISAVESNITKRYNDYFAGCLKGNAFDSVIASELKDRQTLTREEYQSIVSAYFLKVLTDKTEDLCKSALAGRSLSQATKDSIITRAQETMRLEVEKTITSILGADPSASLSQDGESFSQACYWMETIYADYAKTARELNSEITATYGLLVFGKETIPSGGYANDESIKGPIEALDAYGWEEVYLDSYQVELLKARAVQSYWEKELEVAQAVYDYSVNFSYTRDTEATTLAKYEQTLATYQTALEQYQQAVVDLEKVDAGLLTNKDKIAGIQARLKAKKEELTKANAEYADLLVMAELNDTGYYTGQYKAYYEELLALRGLRLDETTNDNESASGAYATSAAAYYAHSYLEGSTGIVSALINGDPLAETPIVGILDLKKRVTARNGFAAKIDRDACATIKGFTTYIAEGLALDADDAWFGLLVDAHEAYLDDGDFASLENLLLTAAGTLAADAAGTLERQMMSVRLLLAPDVASACAAAADIVPGNLTGDSVETTVTALETGKSVAEIALLSDRLGTERAALQKLVDNLTAFKATKGTLDGFHAVKSARFGDSAVTLAWTLDGILQEQGIQGDALLERTTGYLSSLNMLATVLDNPSITAAERPTLLRNLAIDDPLIALYLDGRTVFSSERGVDYTLAHVKDSYSRVVAISNAAIEYETYSNFACAFEGSYREQSLSALNSWLESNNLGSVSGNKLNLKDPVSIWNDFRPGSEQAVIERVAALQKGVDAALASEGMPLYVKESVANWLSGVTSLLMIRGMDTLHLDSVGTGTLETKATASASKSANFDELMNGYFDESGSAETRSFTLLSLGESGVAIDGALLNAAVSALGDSLAAYRLGLQPDDFTSWDGAYTGWFDGLGLNDAQSARRDANRAAIVGAARSAWETAQVWANPSGYDYAASSDAERLESLDLCKALNRLPLETYLGGLSTAQSTIRATSLALYQIRSYLDAASGSGSDSFDVQTALATISFGGDVDSCAEFIASAAVSDNSPEMATYRLLCGLEAQLAGMPCTVGNAGTALSAYAASVFSHDGYAVAASDGSDAAGLYAALYAASLSESLSDVSASERNGALLMVREATGIGLDASLDLDAFSTGSLGDRAIQAAKLDDRAFVYTLKSALLAGSPVDAYLAGASVAIAGELSRFRAILDAANGYMPAYDGDVVGYLQANAGNAGFGQESRLRALLLQERGDFDDVAFYKTSTSVLGFLTARRERDADALDAVGYLIAPSLSARSAELTSRASDDAVALDFARDFNVLAKESAGAYRKYLADDTFVLDVAGGQTWETESLPFTKSARTDVMALDAAGSISYSDDARLNDGLEYASRVSILGDALEGIFNAWGATDIAVTAAEYLAANASVRSVDAITANNLSALADFTAHEVGSALTGEYEAAKETYVGRIAQGENLVLEMGKMGAMVDKFNAEKEDNEELARLTNEAKGKIDRLESEAKAIERDWDDSINFVVDGLSPDTYDEAGYKQLEAEYRARYQAARATFDELDQAKQAQKSAKAIYEYASTPYLRVSATPSDDAADAAAAFEAVDPDTRLLDAKDHLARADAAVDALESLYGDGSGQKSLYERDSEYAKLRDAYAESYRYRIASLQAQELLTTEVKKAETELADAKAQYAEAIATPINGLSDIKAADIQSRINGLNAERKMIIQQLRITDGTVGFSKTGAFDVASLEAYFAKPESGGYSQFEVDLSDWMIRNSGRGFYAWDYALSWEEYRLGGGMSGSEYSAYVKHDRETQEAEWSKIDWDTTCMPTYVAPGFASMSNVMETIFREYGGPKPKDSLKKAIRNGDLGYYVARAEKYSSWYQATPDYAFFKMLVLLNGLDLGSGYTSGELINSCIAYEFFDDAYDTCQHKGTKACFKRKWHNARDAAEVQRNKAREILNKGTEGLSSAQKNIADTAALVAQKKANLKRLTGIDPDTGAVDVSVATLVEGIRYAAERNGPNAMDDILITAGLDTENAREKASVEKLVTMNGTLRGGTDESLSKFLAVKAYGIESAVDASETALNTYLYAEGSSETKEGIARTQAKNEKRYEAAYAAYVAGGILPDETVSAATISRWESMLRDDLSDPEAGSERILDAARLYLGAMPERSGDDRAIRNLRDAWASYGSAKTWERADALVAVRDSFVSLVAAYRTGVSYLAALESAADNPVYNGREDALRAHEDYQNLLGDLVGEQSGLKTVGLDDVTASLETSFNSMNAKRLAALKAIRENEWDILEEELVAERNLFEDQMDAILSRGSVAWKNAGQKLSERRAAWEAQYQSSFIAKENAWDERYLGFLECKEAWIKDITAQAVNLGDKEILNRIPTLTEDYIAKANDFIIADVIEAPDTANLIGDILDDDLLSGLLASAKHLSKGISNFTPAIFQILKRDPYTTGETLDRIREYQTGEDEELQARIAYIQYDQALETLKDARKEVQETIDRSNEESWNGFRKMFISDGFSQEGQNFVKETIVGSTLTDTLEEDHVIEGYRNFQTTIRDFTQDFAKPESIDPVYLGYTGIQALLDQAMEAVPKEYERIFGKRDEKGNWLDATYLEQTQVKEKYMDVRYVLDSASNDYIETLVEKTRKVQSVRGVTQETYNNYTAYLASIGDDDRSEAEKKRRMVVTGNGLYNEWVGYAPIMDPEPDSDLDVDEYQKNVRFSGAGETGRIMGMYMQHKMIEASGEAACNQPAYNQKLWDDRGNWFQAPTPRKIIDIAISIVATIYCGPVGAMIVNMLDDALFTMMDIANGADMMGSLESFGKSAAISAVSSGIGAGFNAIQSATTISSTLLKGTEIMANNVAASSINATNFRGLVNGGNAFDSKAFAKGAFGKEAMVGVVAGMAGHAVSSGANIALVDKNLLGFSAKNIGNVSKLANTMGNLASAGVTYGMTGRTTLNLLNLSMLGLKNRENKKDVNLGLFELNVGKNGVTGGIGMGGIDMNVGMLARAMGGMNVLYQNQRIADFKKANQNLDASIAMRALYSSGDKEGRSLYSEFLGGKAKLAVNEKLEANAEAQTTRENGQRVVTMRNLGGGLEGGILSAVVLQHEAYRDGYEGADQEAETKRAVEGHTGMAIRMVNDGLYAGIIESNGGLAADIKNYKAGGDAYAKYVNANYDSSKDYWKLKKDGSIAYDGFATLRDEDGNVIRSASSMGVKETQVEGGLIQILGLDKNNPEHIAAVQNMMKGSGMKMNADGLWNKTGIIKTVYNNGVAINLTGDLEQYNMGKSIGLYSIGKLFTEQDISKSVVNKFINANYGSAIGMLNMTGTTQTAIADSMLSKVYNQKQISMIHSNQTWYNNAVKNGVLVDSMVTGKVSRTSEFGVDTGDLGLKSSSVDGAAFFRELHTGLDYGSGGDTVQTPGGFWELYDRKEHRAYFELFGGDTRMRIMHIDPKEIQAMEINQVYGVSEGARKLFNYPTESFGSGTGAHIHIDFTQRLPYSGRYERQFVNPETQRPGNLFNYSYTYKSSSLEDLPGYPLNFNRF